MDKCKNCLYFFTDSLDNRSCRYGSACWKNEPEVKNDETKCCESSEIKNALRYHLSSLLDKGYKKEEILGVFLYGSQNYNFSYAGSDVDTKAIIIPSWNRLVEGKMLSKQYTWDNGEHCEVKDIREFAKMFYKQNINFLEILHTSYSLVNSEFEILWKNTILPLREKISYYNINYNILSTCGQAISTLSQALKSPGSKDVNKKYANALRLYRYLECYKNKEKYVDCIYLPDDFRDKIIGYKTGEKIATEEMIETLRHEFEIVQNTAPTFAEDVEAKKELDNAISNLIWYKVSKDLYGYFKINFE